MLINIVPVPKPRMTMADRWKRRPATDRYWAFKDSLKEQVSGSLGGSFEVIFYMPMPKSWSKKKQAQMLIQPHQQKPDIDNLLKGLMDALCDEDQHVYNVQASKYWATEGSIELTER